jgi:endo-1,4-beta-xylanase
MTKGILLLGGSLLLYGCAHVATASRATTLQDAYREVFLMGSAVNEAIDSGADSASREIVVRQLNTITAENALKAERVNPRPGVSTSGRRMRS